MPLTRRQIYRRRRMVVFGGLFAALAGITYLPLTLLAPVVEVEPEVTTPIVAAQEPGTHFWPEYGASAIGAIGHPGVLAASGSTDAVPMASITKVVTALTVLDAHPLQGQDTGPTITMDSSDIDLYWSYIARNGSVSPVRSGLAFTERELLELSLIDSANNYTSSLAHWAFGDDAGFQAAARAWLDANGFPGIVVVEPSGIDRANVATASDLIRLGELALAHPVIAEIVGTPSRELHDLGTLRNTNKLIGTDGVDGIKTGTLDGFGANLLFSSDVVVGDETVQLVGVVLGGPDHATINAHIRSMIQTAAAGFREVPLVAAGDVLLEYETAWGQRTRGIATESASVVVWGDTPITATVSGDRIRLADEGSAVGEIVFTVGDETITVPVALDATLEDPGPWWRLGHPGLVFGME